MRISGHYRLGTGETITPPAGSVGGDPAVLRGTSLAGRYRTRT